jgi:ABC-type antimicrobial peptide transport system permease subunit
MERLEFTVVGIIDSNERLAILADESYALYLLDDFDFSLVDLYDGSIELIDGRMPSDENEILMADYMFYNIGDNINIYDMFYQVVGTYKVLNDSVLPTKNWLLTEEGFENVLLMQMTYLPSGIGRYVFYSNDIDQAMKDIRDLDFNFDYELFNMAERDRENYMSQMAFRISQAVTTILFTLAGIVLFIYFLMRTSMITRVKEIGIYRAIGATKKDVYKIFISEVLVVTTFLSVTAFLIAVYVLNEVEKGIGDYFSLFYLPYWLVILGLIGIYAVNLFFGLLPVYGLLRKTPSEILSKYDI